MRRNYWLLMEGDGGNGGGSGGSGGDAVQIPELPENWVQGLPDDLKNEETLKLYRDVPNLAKALVHAKKMVGANKVTVPSKHATPEDWKAFFQGVGLPKDETEYSEQIKLPEGFEEHFDETGLAAFKKFAHENNIFPHQANGFLEWLYSQNKEALDSQVNKIKTSRSEEEANLKKEWGEAYAGRMSRADLAMKEITEKVPGFKEFMETQGLTQDIKMKRLFYEVANLMKEDSFQGKDSVPTGPSPEELVREVNDVMADPKHPYNDRNHPNHDLAVKDMQKKFTRIYGT